MNLISNIKPNWIAIQRFDDDMQPLPNIPYKITFDDGAVLTGKLDSKGYARHEHVPDGNAKVEYQESSPKEEANKQALSSRINKLLGGV